VTDLEDQADAILRRSEALLAEAVAGTKMPAPVSIQRVSSNRKLAPQGVEYARSGRRRNVPRGPFVSSTYVSISATCPDTCRWKDNGCYAQDGSASGRVPALDRGARRMTGLEVAEAEAAAIDALFRRRVPQDGARGGRDLRLHVSGDVAGAKSARVLAAAAARWQARGGGSVWTYTHRWREVPRDAWGPVAVLASVEHPSELWEALHRGYAPAFVVPTFPSDSAFYVNDVRLVPCPAEHAGRTCAECRLCMDPDLAKRKTGIAFAFHAPHPEDGRRRLRVLQARNT